MDRRKFKITCFQGAAAVAIGAVSPRCLNRALARTLSQPNLASERILVVIQLSGGNDGLNTIVPFRNEIYYRLRPKLAIPRQETVSLNSEMALHPSLRGIASLIENQNFSAIQGVGYPRPNRSHFESMDIWHTCHTKHLRRKEGWLGRMAALAHSPVDDQSSFGIHLGNEPMPLALMARGANLPSLATADQLRWKSGSPNENDLANSAMENASTPSGDKTGTESLLDFVETTTSVARSVGQRLERVLASGTDQGDFPKTPLGEKLQTISRLILSGMGTRVYYVTLDGFDTHANQMATHASLLRQWSEGLLAFHDRIESGGMGDRVLALTFSEFGRRLAENASFGTDHGAAAPVFLSGPRLSEPLIGPNPDLSQLDDGDLRFQVDFRSVYASIMEDWLRVDPETILEGKFTKVGGLRLGQDV